MPRYKWKQMISRREFLRTGSALGGLALAASLLEACARAGLATPTQVPQASPTPAASPIPVKEEDMVRLAFVKTRDRREGVQRALQLLRFNPVQGKQVLLKPNFNSADPAPASTHPDTLRVLAEELWAMGAQSITVADRSGMGATRGVMRELGVFDMAQELEFDTLVFDEMGKDDWVVIQPPDSHWKKGFAFARPCLEVDAVVQTCCLKPHRFGGHFTMSLKNSVGMVASVVPGGSHDYMGELHSSPYQRLMIAEINTAYTPALVVMDSVEAFISAGPDKGRRAWGEVVVAGTDRVAIDVVGLALLRHLGYTGVSSKGPIFQQQQIARAVELGLGVDLPEKIQLVTEDPDSESYAAQIREILLHG